MLKSWLKLFAGAEAPEGLYLSHAGSLHERAQSSLACLTIASRGLTVAHKPAQYFGSSAASSHLQQGFQN